jgi:hypothetical protein
MKHECAYNSQQSHIYGNYHIYGRKTRATQPISHLNFMTCHPQELTLIHPQQSPSHMIANCKQLHVSSMMPKSPYIYYPKVAQNVS